MGDRSNVAAAIINPSSPWPTSHRGMSKAAIARQVGASRRTVYRWIASGQPHRELDDETVRYGPTRPRPSKLGPYKGVSGLVWPCNRS